MGPAGSATLLGLAVVVILLWGLYTRIRLVRLRAKAEASWSDIDAQLRRRWDLVPDLVDAVRGCVPHERTIFERAAAALALALDATTPPAKAEAEQGLKDALFPVFALAEGCPNLAESERFLAMQRVLEEAGDAIERSRRTYNATVRELNAAVLRFPRSLVAGLFRFSPRRYYALPEDEMREALGVGR